MTAERRCRKCHGRIAEPARCVQGHHQPDAPYERLAEVLAENIDYDRLAEKVAERLRGFVVDLAAQVPADPAGLVTVRELARLVGMSERWVYDHSEQLGVVRTGSGSRPRLRFDPERALALLAEHDGEAPAVAAQKLERRELPAADLLPVRGRAA
jgi:hypothetical protein